MCRLCCRHLTCLASTIEDQHDSWKIKTYLSSERKTQNLWGKIMFEPILKKNLLSKIKIESCLCPSRCLYCLRVYVFEDGDFMSYHFMTVGYMFKCSPNHCGKDWLPCKALIVLLEDFFDSRYATSIQTEFLNGN